MPGKLKKKLFFRADGNSRIGLGHVIRSLALAEIIKENFHMTFLIKSPGEYLIAEINQVCDELIVLPSGFSIETEAQYIISLSNPDDLIVLDGYAFDESYQRILKTRNLNIICIDDIYSTHFLADTIINHTSDIPVQNYSAEYYTRFYLGAENALLRVPFLTCATDQRDIRTVERAFVSFGGADPNNYTCRLAGELMSTNRFKMIDVVIGAAFSHKDELIKMQQRTNTGIMAIHESLDADQIVEIMRQSQIGICAASTVAFEYCCVGGGLLVIKTAGNQEDSYRFLLNDRLAIPYSAEAIQSISLGDIHHMVDVQKIIFNGGPIKNLKALFHYYLVKDHIEYRRATEKDAEVYFHWANDPDVRKNSIHKAVIDWEPHVRWFRNKVIDPGSILLVFSFYENLIGQVRLDLIEEKWLISFSIDRAFRGKGYAEIIVYKAILSLKTEIDIPFSLKAQVQDDNFPSLRVFQHLGFIEGSVEVLHGQVFRNFFKEAR